MINRIRHWLRLPLLTKRERRNLNGFWWDAVTEEFVRASRNGRVQLTDTVKLADTLDEFLEAIKWLERMKA